MKNAFVSIFLLLFLTSTLYLSNTFAQDYTQWDLPEGAKARLGKGWIPDIQYSPDGTRLAVASSIGVWIYDAQTGAELDLLTGHTPIWSVSFSPDGNIIASGSFDSPVRLSDANTGRHLQTLTGHTNSVRSVAFSPNGQTLASGSADYTIRLWDINTETHLQTLTGHTRSVNSVAFSPDGNTLASGSGDGTIRLWSSQTRQQIWAADTPQKQMLDEERKLPLPGVFRTNKPTRPFRSPFEMLGLQWVLAVAYSPDSQTLASSGSSDGTIQLWNVANGTHLRTLKGHTEMVRTLAFLPDGKTLVSGSDDDALRMWDTDTGTMLRQLSGHSNDVKSVVFSRDGKMLASGSEDASVRLWDAETGRFLPTLRGHFWEIKAVAFSPDSKTVVSADDSTILFWDWKELAKSQR